MLDPNGNIIQLSNPAHYENWAHKTWSLGGEGYDSWVRSRDLMATAGYVEGNGWRRDTAMENHDVMSLMGNNRVAESLARSFYDGTDQLISIDLGSQKIRNRTIEYRSGQPWYDTNTAENIGDYVFEGGGMMPTAKDSTPGVGTSYRLMPNGADGIGDALADASVGVQQWLFSKVVSTFTDDDEQVTLDTMYRAPHSSPLGIMHRANPSFRPTPEYLIKVGQLVGLPAADQAERELQDMRVQGKDEESLYKQINTWDDEGVDWSNRPSKPKTAMQQLMAALNSELPINFDLYENLDLENIAKDLGLVELPENIRNLIKHESQDGQIPPELRTQVQLQQLLKASHRAAEVLLKEQLPDLAVDRMDTDTDPTVEFATAGEKIAANHTMGLAVAVFGLDHIEHAFAIAGSSNWGLDENNLKKSWDKLDPSTQKLLKIKGYSPKSFSAAWNPVIFSLYANRTAQGIAAGTTSIDVVIVVQLQQLLL